MVLDLFSKSAISAKLPEGMKKAVSKLKKAKGQMECLEEGYEIVTSRFKGYFIETWIWLWELFYTDMNRLWSMKRMHCTNLNYLLRVLLVRSGWFRDSDIEVKWTLNKYISPHQYLRVRVGKKFVNVDIWGRWYGVKFGKYATGFGQK